MKRNDEIIEEKKVNYIKSYVEKDMDKGDIND
jgi:hypothetical protein